MTTTSLDRRWIVDFLQTQHYTTPQQNNLKSIMPSKAFTVLGHLQNYVDASEKAQGELKSCMWQLTKSRRNVRSGIIGVDSTTAYTAELLREELRAQIRVVEADGDIDLVSEDASLPKDRKDNKQAAPQWKLQNVLAEMEQAAAAAAATTTKSQDKSAPSGNQTANDAGIRHRKQAVASLDTNPSSSWTMVEEEDYIEEDEKILRSDPIKLFGGYFPALELKVAQRNAREALATYIQAANEAAKLLELLRESEKK